MKELCMCFTNNVVTALKHGNYDFFSFNIKKDFAEQKNTFMTATITAFQSINSEQLFKQINYR